MDELGGLRGRLTFGGLSTGLDTGALVDALIQAERRPLVLLQNSRAAIDARRQALQTFNTKVLALRDAARAVDNRLDSLAGPSATEEFLAFQATFPVVAPPPHAPLPDSPFHFVAPSSYVIWGPYMPVSPPSTLEAVCVDVTGGVVGPVSAVAHLTVQ